MVFRNRLLFSFNALSLERTPAGIKIRRYIKSFMYINFTVLPIQTLLHPNQFDFVNADRIF